MKAIELIENERIRQKQVEGWTTRHDDTHIDGELVMAAVTYLLPIEVRKQYERKVVVTDGDHVYEEKRPAFWPWFKMWWKPTPKNRIRELVKAGALIVAEIERLQRKGEQ